MQELPRFNFGNRDSDEVRRCFNPSDLVGREFENCDAPPGQVLLIAKSKSTFMQGRGSVRPPTTAPTPCRPFPALLTENTPGILRDYSRLPNTQRATSPVPSCL